MVLRQKAGVKVKVKVAQLCQFFATPGDLLNPGIEPRSPTLQADSLPAEPQGKAKNAGGGVHSIEPIPSPTDLPDPGIEPGSLAFAGGFFTDRFMRKAGELSQ